VAFIKAKSGKKGLTYYIVYNQKVRLSDGTQVAKKKCLKVGATKTEAQQALWPFEKELKEKPSNFIAKHTVLFSSFVNDEYLPWCKTRKNKSQYERGLHSMKLRENKNRVRFFSKEEIKRILDVANPYIKRFFIVGISTGLRLQEMLHLKLSNIDVISSVIHVVNDGGFQTKNGRNRDIPISNFLSVIYRFILKHLLTLEMETRVAELGSRRRICFVTERLGLRTLLFILCDIRLLRI